MTVAALIVAILVMAAMSLWLPSGDAKIDNLVIPVVLFPIIWALVFFYALMDSSLKRASLVLLLLFLVNGGAVVASIMGLLS